MTAIKRITIHVECDDGEKVVMTVNNPKKLQQTIDPIETFESDIWRTFKPGTMSVITITSPADDVKYSREL